MTLPSVIALPKLTDETAQRANEIIQRTLNVILMAIAGSQVSETVDAPAFYPMGARDTANLTGGTWYVLLQNGNVAGYYGDSEDRRLAGLTIFLAAGSTPASAIFRVRNLDTGATLWTSPTVAKGALVTCLKTPPLRLAANTTFVVDINTITTGPTSASATMKVLPWP